MTTLAIGAGYWQNSEYFVGKVDEVRVYDRALEKDEAKKNFAVKSNNMAVEAIGKLSNVWGGIKSR